MLGGYELLAYKTVQALQERGHEIYVATGRGRELVSDDCIMGMYDLDLDHKEDEFLRETTNYVMQIKRYLFHPGNYRTTKKLIEQINPDIISVWNLYLLSVAPLIAARHMRVETVTHLTDRWLLYNTKDILALRSNVRGIERLALAMLRATVQPILYRLVHPSNLIVPSKSLRATYLEAGFQEDAFHLIPHGIELHLFPYTARERHPERLGLLYIGQLWEGKGVQVLLRALGHLLRTGYSQFRLSIYGAGTAHFLEYLRNIVAEERLHDYVTFCGTVPYEELPHVYKTHDILIFPAIWNEPFPLVPLEAMCSGLPVIASTAGGTKEAVRPNETGLLVPPNDSQSLADAILTLMMDGEMRQRLGRQAAGAASEEYSLEGMIAHVEELYHSVLANSTETGFSHC